MIFYQDFKDRLVYWWLFPLIAVNYAILHSVQVGFDQFLIHISFSCGMTVLMLGVILIYHKIRFKSFVLTNALGLGDILILFAFALGFSPVSFISLLVFGLLFALLLHQIMSALFGKSVRRMPSSQYGSATFLYASSVPLAGYLGVFFALVMIVHWLGAYPNLYQI